MQLINRALTECLPNSLNRSKIGPACTLCFIFLWKCLILKMRQVFSALFKFTICLLNFTLLWAKSRGYRTWVRVEGDYWEIQGAVDVRKTCTSNKTQFSTYSQFFWEDYPLIKQLETGLCPSRKKKFQQNVNLVNFQSLFHNLVQDIIQCPQLTTKTTNIDMVDYS